MHPVAPVLPSVAPVAAALPGAALRAGQVLEARVLAAQSGGGVLLEANGQRLVARTGLPLAPGQQLTLKVQTTVRETVLQLVDSRGAAGGGEIRLLSADAAARGAAAGPRLELASPLRLPPGEVIEARVLQAQPGGRVLLAVRGEAVPARAQGFPAGAEPARGQTLHLRSEAAGSVLRLLPGTPGAPATDGATLALGLLKEALPRQQPLARAVAELARAARDPGLRAGASTAAVSARLDALLAALPRAGEVADPARLAAMVRDSGLFHEADAARADAAHGARGAATGVPDLKGRLLAVARAVGAGGGAMQAALEPVVDAVRGALARIETLQVASTQAGPDSPAWYLELPLTHPRGIDELRLRIARERRGGGAETSHVWSAELLLRPAEEGAGALHARVSLTPGGVVAVLTTEDAALHRRLEARRPELVALMEDARLDVASVRCRCAPVPELAPPMPLARLVSERA